MRASPGVEYDDSERTVRNDEKTLTPSLGMRGDCDPALKGINDRVKPSNLSVKRVHFADKFERNPDSDHHKM